jgi:hypothetical protein
MNGIACRLGVPLQQAGKLVAVLDDDCLDLTVRAVHRGKHVVRLTHLHDGQVLATTADDLELYFHDGRHGRELRLRLFPDSYKGRAAICFVKSLSYCCLSVGLSALAGTMFRDQDRAGRLMIVRRAVLEEIAVVPEGACPGCLILRGFS